mgnify:FL=1
MSWRKRFDPLARRFGFYLSYTISEEEFIGTLSPGWVSTLKANGYEPSPRIMGIKLEAAKIHPETGAVHDFSLRKVDPENPKYQYHAHMWTRSDGLARVAVHYEARPDVRRIGDESLSDAKQRLQTHYRPEGDEYLKGVADDTLKELVE